MRQRYLLFMCSWLAVALVTVGGWSHCHAEEPVVVASIHPLADLARQVAGSSARVVTLLPPGASPHGYEPTAKQLVDLAEAELILVVGLGLDDWVVNSAIRVRKGPVPVLEMAALVEHDWGSRVTHDHGAHHGEDHAGHAHGDGFPDAHLWLDPVIAGDWIKLLRGRLEVVNPGSTALIRQRARRVMDELVELDGAYRESLGKATNKKMITFHNAFDRLAERYGLEVVAHLSPVELTPGGEVMPKRLVEAIQLIKRHGLGVIYSEPQFPDSAVRAISDQAGVRVLKLDPLGSPRVQGYETYQQMMRSNLDVLVAGQSAGVAR